MSETIKTYWNEQAKTIKYDPCAVTGDVLAAEMEVKEVLKYLRDGQRVLDIGCGNGIKDAEYCQQKYIKLTGIDFSNEMIAVAKKFENDRLKFRQGDILELSEHDKYDVIITTRCLINLDSSEKQILAIDNVFNALKPNGTYLMLECNKVGLERINAIRKDFDLEPITERWHNKYLDDEILSYTRYKFRHVEENNFLSTYFLISRTINAVMGYSYGSEINKFATMLPPLGDYDPLKMLIMRK